MSGLPPQRILIGHVQGEQGERGPTPNVTASATSGAAGTNASVLQSGPPENRHFAFTIPRGEPGPGGGVEGARSHTVPIVWRAPFDNPGGGSLIRGAMALHDADAEVPNPAEPWYRYPRVYFFTNHPTQGILRARGRTVNDTRMEPTDFELRACPVNFGSAGYCGNWCVSDQVIGGIPYESVFELLYDDFDGIAFCGNNTALWVRRKMPALAGPALFDDRMQVSQITLQGVPTGTVTACWASKTPARWESGGPGGWTPHPAENNFWQVKANQLYRAHFINGLSSRWDMTNHQWDGEKFINYHTGLPETPPIIQGTPRRIVGPESFPFVQVTDPALPTAMSGVYAERQFAAVWGTNPANRIAYFDGATWYALTVPFNFPATGDIKNSVVIYSNGRLGVLNRALGDYYTCDDPTAGGTFELRYRVVGGLNMIRGWQLGIPQFLSQSGSWETYCEFDSKSHEGGRVAANPHGTSVSQTYMYWPANIWCSTDRPDIIPSSRAIDGYMYAYGTKTTNVSIFGDQQTYRAITSTWSGTTTPQLPPMVQGSVPWNYLGPSSRRAAYVIRDEPPGRRILEMTVSNPQNVG